LLCLIANNRSPWPGVAIGTPILTLSKVTGLDVEALSATSGRIPALPLALDPVLAGSGTMVGWREDVRRLACTPDHRGGRSPPFSFFWSNFVGFELVDLMSAVASMNRRRDRDQTLETQEGMALRTRW